jgi:hypothetical protein
MSGFELSRFVNLSQSESEDYICSICQDIFRNPVVTVVYKHFVNNVLLGGWKLIIRVLMIEKNSKEANYYLHSSF